MDRRTFIKAIGLAGIAGVPNTKDKSPEEIIDELVEIQKRHGNWDYDPYMQGMANGMILCQAIIKGKDPKYLDAPKEWLKQ